KRERGTIWNEGIYERKRKKLSASYMPVVFRKLLSGLFMRFSFLFSGPAVSEFPAFDRCRSGWMERLLPLEERKRLPGRKNFTGTLGAGESFRKECICLSLWKRGSSQKGNPGADPRAGRTDRLYCQMVS